MGNKGKRLPLAVKEESLGRRQNRTGSLYGAIRRMLEAGLIEQSHARPDPELDGERRRCYGRADFGRRVPAARAARLARAPAVIQGKRAAGGA